MPDRFSRAVAIVVGLSAIGLTTATAQSQPVPPLQFPTPRVQPQPPEPPSSPFFVVPGEPWFPNQTPRAEEAAKPKVVCGMTVIPADPRSDPKFVIPQPRPETGRTIKPMIRTVTPALCR
ncbi:MAG TPA: hypothetical protein VI485_20805 [Vicinamibacterales bacterium]|nr:hypothetical protein [Vicinamibacterales bacterium]